MFSSFDDLDPAIVDAVRRATVIITPTDAGREPSFVTSRAVAIALAKLSGARLVLVDREDVTWGDTPHQSATIDRDTMATMGPEGAHMLVQMDEAIAAGVDVRAWRTSIPSMENYDEAITALGPDLSVAPIHLTRPTVLARLRRTKPAESARDRHPELPVIGVETDGSLRLL